MKANSRQDLEREKWHYMFDNRKKYKDGLGYSKSKEVNNDTRKPTRPRQ